ncbi:hypothetical protein B0H21DRAFT_707318 [Amylocystis lapponica]|nr:hypothetical protein B0H21DRAFT_707318 [Amylocystis lapponica]
MTRLRLTTTLELVPRESMNFATIAKFAAVRRQQWRKCRTSQPYRPKDDNKWLEAAERATTSGNMSAPPCLLWRHPPTPIGNTAEQTRHYQQGEQDLALRTERVVEPQRRPGVHKAQHIRPTNRIHHPRTAETQPNHLNSDMVSLYLALGAVLGAALSTSAIVHPIPPISGTLQSTTSLAWGPGPVQLPTTTSVHPHGIPTESENTPPTFKHDQFENAK